ncbi:hypothetical protein [Sulfurimonas sp.]|uniref:hypothetical protein n=1 Tax=Sulfurimonas sp. TaxID=2022749 RepID=UPI002AAFF488|nr:hypothetical protein [Sulfurimonas sp.]
MLDQQKINLKHQRYLDNKKTREEAQRNQERKRRNYEAKNQNERYYREQKYKNRRNNYNQNSNLQYNTKIYNVNNFKNKPQLKLDELHILGINSIKLFKKDKLIIKATNGTFALPRDKFDEAEKINFNEKLMKFCR